MKRMQIRLPDSVHERIHKLARQDNVSMNQFMVTAISNEIVRQETHAFFKPWVDAFDEDAFQQALEVQREVEVPFPKSRAQVPNLTPELRIGSPAPELDPCRFRPGYHLVNPGVVNQQLAQSRLGEPGNVRLGPGGTQ